MQTTRKFWSANNGRYFFLSQAAVGGVAVVLQMEEGHPCMLELLPGRASRLQQTKKHKCTAWPFFPQANLYRYIRLLGAFPVNENRSTYHQLKAGLTGVSTYGTADPGGQEISKEGLVAQEEVHLKRRQTAGTDTEECLILMAGSCRRYKR